MAFEAVDACFGTPHISSDDLAALNTAVIGKANCVLSYGDSFKAVMSNANECLIGTGVGMVGGRRFWNQATCSLTIQSGTQGQKRNDLVVARYSRTSAGIESIEPVVVKGTPSVDKPTDPKVGVNDLRLWRIPLDGINAGKPVALFEAVSPLATVGAAVAYATYDTGWYVAYTGDDIDVRARRIGDAVYLNGRLRGYTVTTSWRAITTLPPLYSPDVQTYFAGSGTDGNNVVQMDIEPDGKLYAKTMGGEVKGVVFSACYAVPERPHRL